MVNKWRAAGTNGRRGNKIREMGITRYVWEQEMAPETTGASVGGNSG